MKTQTPAKISPETGTALMLTLVMTGIALAILGSAMTWSATSTRQTHRLIQYNRSVAAAEAASEIILAHIARDYTLGGEQLVSSNLASYKLMVPKPAVSAFWNQWEFNNAQGDIGQTFVKGSAATNYVLLNSIYSPLRGFISTYTVVAHARETAVLQGVQAGVLQEVQLAKIPIFQHAMYSSGDMEISCGQHFTVTGQVHANGTLYTEPEAGTIMTFNSGVTAVAGILKARHPNDGRAAPPGSVVYEKTEFVNPSATAIILPIGATNTVTAIREIIQPAPAGEDPNSLTGRLRYHNLAQMILVVSNSGISATSGRFNNFATAIPTNELAKFVSITNNFRDAREGKTVRPIDINIGVLTTWSQTNKNLYPALGSNVMSSIYVVDRRTLTATNLGAVRLTNGRILPSRGLTVATARPLYVQGHYNQTNVLNDGTTNTVATRPASLVADAITFLSTAWKDTNSTLALSSRVPAPTTVNAALLAGIVETAGGNYSGGMENFPRLLEKWGSPIVIFTWNGSMVKLFPSQYATNLWAFPTIYSAPQRNWAFDSNFYDANKLPPLTPSLVKVFRGQWAIAAPKFDSTSSCFLLSIWNGRPVEQFHK